jgi:phage-related tail fiber protein
MAFFTILTSVGQAKIANAVALGQQIQLTEMALGDGNGNATTPNQAQTGLVREVYRAQLNQLSTDPANPNYVVAELVVPSDQGGWTVREVGLYDVDGNLIAVGNFPETYKPVLAEGASRDLVVRIIIEVSNASVVQLKIDPSIVLASRQWVVSQFLLRSKVAGGLAGQVLTKKTNTEEDFQWVDPTAAVDVIVDVKPERQTLAAAQTIVNFALIVASGISVYVEGVRLIETVDFNVTGAAQITLAVSYPAGSVIHAYQNEALDGIAGASEAQRGLVFLATQAEASAGVNATDAITPATLAAVLAAIGVQLSPPGQVGAFARATAPTGWLKANGAAVSRTTYNALFAAIGTTFGVGNGSTTFNLPDLRGEFIRGLDDGRGVDAGRLLGSAQADMFESHLHGIGTTTFVSGGGGVPYGSGVTQGTAQSELTGGTETRPRNVALLYCIKV